MLSAWTRRGPKIGSARHAPEGSRNVNSAKVGPRTGASSSSTRFDSAPSSYLIPIIICQFLTVSRWLMWHLLAEHQPPCLPIPGRIRPFPANPEPGADTQQRLAKGAAVVVQR